MACNVSSYNLGVRNILLGKTTKQSFCISAKADVAGSLAGKYFVLHEPVTQAKHVFWMDNGVASAPTVPNATLTNVVYVNNASASTIATAIAGSLNGKTWIGTATASGAHVDADMDVAGYAYEVRDALDPLKQTKFKFTLVQYGRVQEDLGATNGDITATIEEQTIEITSPQTGDYVLGEIRRGVRVSMSFELKSTAADDIRKALNFYGGTFVTDDAASAIITGYGSGNLFKSTEDVATQLILREPDYAESDDASQDFTLHKAKLKLGELTFSAENEFVLPIEVIGYLDKTKFSGLNMFTYGDASKVPSV
jgi:hypothetical protein